MTNAERLLPKEDLPRSIEILQEDATKLVRESIVLMASPNPGDKEIAMDNLKFVADLEYRYGFWPCEGTLAYLRNLASDDYTSSVLVRAERYLAMAQRYGNKFSVRRANKFVEKIKAAI